MSNTPLFITEEVRKGLASLVVAGDVFEIRAVKAQLAVGDKPLVVSGYFDSIDAALAELPRIVSATGIYVALNPVLPELLARRKNQLGYAVKGSTTSDDGITTRRWLLVDVDPTRPADTSATDAEKDAATSVMKAVLEYLKARGWPNPMGADSGNGWHALYPIDLPCEDGGMVERVLKHLAHKFDTAYAAVDTAVHNPSRIVKLYGTLAAKGENTAERPHRFSKLCTNQAVTVGVVSQGQLKELAGDAVAAPPPPLTKVPKTEAELDIDEPIVRSALATIPAEDRNLWLKIGGALHLWDSGDRGRNLWDDWSKTSPDNYNETDQLKTWNGFDDSRKKAATIGTIYKLAGNSGWKRPPADPTKVFPVIPETAHGQDALRAFMEDQRPKIQLPCDNRTIGDFAKDVAANLSKTDVYLLNDNVVRVTNGVAHEITAQEIRTLVEKHFACYKIKGAQFQTFDVKVNMLIDTAHCLLASPFLKEGLRRIIRVNRCQLPVLRGNGVIELLPEGYDTESQTLTVITTDYPKDVPLAEAVATINDLLGEFIFADGDRSKAVAVSMLLSLYAGNLIPQSAHRPCFIVTKNAEGAGAGTLVSLSVVPVMGSVSMDTLSNEEAEIKKALLTAVLSAQLVIVLDNQKGRLDSAALESFLSAASYKGRRLGVNVDIEGPNLATVFATMNGCEASPDIRRRSLFVELLLDVERAEDKVFKRRLTHTVILTLRSKVLGALYSLVRHWDSKGRPIPMRSHSEFPEWADVTGGVVEAAGFGCCLETARVALTADTDGDDMRAMVFAMAMKGKPLTFDELASLARELGCFESVISAEIGFKKAEQSRLGKMLTRYNRRHVDGYQFLIEGKGRSRRFSVYCSWMEGDHGLVGCSTPKEQPNE